METRPRPFTPPLLRTKNYIQVAAIEIALIFSVLVMGDIARFFGAEPTDPTVAVFLLLPEAVYVFILYRLATFLTDSKRAHRMVALALGAVAILSVIGLLPVLSDAAIKSDILIIVHCGLCAVECYLIALGLQDIYIDRLTLRERLWGSVAVYLLIAIGWASFYEIFLLLNNDALGVALVPGYQTYSEALYYSLCSLSGSGTVYATPAHYIRNLALIESVWGVLFLVMLIGRLFTVPDDKS